MQDYVSFFFVRCPNSNQSPNHWLMTRGDILWGFFQIYFTKPPELKEANFCPQLHPCKSSKVYKFAHVQWRGLQKILHVAFLVCYVWKHKLFTPDMPDQFFQDQWTKYRYFVHLPVDKYIFWGLIRNLLFEHLFAPLVVLVSKFSH